MDDHVLIGLDDSGILTFEVQIGTNNLTSVKSRTSLFGESHKHDQRQKAYEDKRTEDIQILRKKIRKAVWKDRQDFKLQNFEEELWCDIKQAKASYLPKHIKLREKSGEKVLHNANLGSLEIQKL